MWDFFNVTILSGKPALIIQTDLEENYLIFSVDCSLFNPMLSTNSSWSTTPHPLMFKLRSSSFRRKNPTMKQEYYQMGQVHGDVISFGSLDDFFRERGNTIDHGGWSLRHLRDKFRQMDVESLYTKYCAQLRKWLLSMLCLLAMAQVGALIGLFLFYAEVGFCLSNKSCLW